MVVLGAEAHAGGLDDSLGDAVAQGVGAAEDDLDAGLDEGGEAGVEGVGHAVVHQEDADVLVGLERIVEGGGDGGEVAFLRGGGEQEAQVGATHGESLAQGKRRRGALPFSKSSGAPMSRSE